jgi:hypothetical protein
MSINEAYFNAPVFESSKALYACRYRSRLEFELMKRLEAEPKIKSFHQPLLVAFVKELEEEKFIYIDFWIEYITGKIDLLFIERSVVISDQAKIYVLSNTKELLKPGNFSFATINQKLSRFRRIASANLTVIGTAGHDDFCFVNFSWIN